MIISPIAKTKKKLFLKDPETTDLGKRIIENSIKLIDELGFDSFNFKKLASSIDSTEASIYRYFENKNKLLFYLISWYWSWVKYNIDYKTHTLKKSC
jgi:AcrR family transcriptional regulator